MFSTLHVKRVFFRSRRCFRTRSMRTLPASKSTAQTFLLKLEEFQKNFYTTCNQAKLCLVASGESAAWAEDERVTKSSRLLHLWLFVFRMRERLSLRRCEQAGKNMHAQHIKKD